MFSMYSWRSLVSLNIHSSSKMHLSLTEYCQSNGTIDLYIWIVTALTKEYCTALLFLMNNARVTQAGSNTADSKNQWTAALHIQVITTSWKRQWWSYGDCLTLSHAFCIHAARYSHADRNLQVYFVRSLLSFISRLGTVHESKVWEIWETTILYPYAEAAVIVVHHIREVLDRKS